MILVTGATGMFGSRTVRQLVSRGARVRALAHSREHAAGLPGEVVVGDLDRPDSLTEPFAGVETVFLISPMDDRIEEREGNALRRALEAGARRIVKLYGAVRHHGDALDKLHRASIDAIRASGVEWALVSPQLGDGDKPALAGRRREGRFGRGGRCGASGGRGPDRARRGRANYELTGPQALSMTDMAAVLTRVLGRTITYNDMPEDDFRRLLVDQGGIPPDEAHIKAILHLRAWRNGDADLVTDTYRALTGEAPLSLSEWVAAHRDAFEAPQVPAPAGT